MKWRECEGAIKKILCDPCTYRADCLAGDILEGDCDFIAVPDEVASWIYEHFGLEKDAGVRDGQG